MKWFSIRCHEYRIPLGVPLLEWRPVFHSWILILAYNIWCSSCNKSEILICAALLWPGQCILVCIDFWILTGIPLLKPWAGRNVKNKGCQMPVMWLSCLPRSGETKTTENTSQHKMIVRSHLKLPETKLVYTWVLEVTESVLHTHRSACYR